MIDVSAIFDTISSLVSDARKIAADLEALKAQLIANPTIDGSASDKIAEEIAAEKDEP